MEKTYKTPLKVEFCNPITLYLFCNINCLLIYWVLIYKRTLNFKLPMAVQTLNWVSLHEAELIVEK